MPKAISKQLIALTNDFMNCFSDPCICLDDFLQVINLNLAAQDLLQLCDKKIANLHYNTLFSDGNAYKLPTPSSILATSKSDVGIISERQTPSSDHWCIKPISFAPDKITFYLIGNQAKLFQQFYEKYTGEEHAQIASPLNYFHKLQQYYENIIAYLPGNIYWKDLNGCFLGCNNNVVKLAGLTDRSEVIGKDDYQFIWKEQAQKVRETDRKIMADGNPAELEETAIMLDKNGTETLVTCLTKKVPLRDTRGNVIGILGTSIDITDRLRAKKAEAEAKTKEIQSKLEGIKTLAYGIAHEVRTPLGVINLSIQRLEKQLGDMQSDTAFTSMVEIKKAAQKAAIIINLILACVKNETINDADFTQLNIDTSLEIIMQQLPASKQQKQRIHLKQPISFNYRGDTTLTDILLYNLLNNALRYIGDAGEIFLWQEDTADFHCLYIKDTGTGIADDLLPHIFQMGVSTNPIGLGAGLGLALCQLIMHVYDGDIQCRSEEGEFTEFVLYFPKSS